MNVETQQNFPLKNLTTFKIGGDAENIFFPKSKEEFVYLLEKLHNPFVMGNWSNTLVSSKGVKGNIISTKKLDEVKFDENYVTAQCGITGPMLSKLVTEKGLSGFEFMSGFPGSLGGNVYMNASASGQAISDKLISAELYDIKNKKIVQMNKEELEFSYRSSRLQKEPYVVLSAKFELENDNSELIQKRIAEILEFRRVHQPNLSLPNAGSVFRNPEGNSAGALLDKAGAKEFSFGEAKVWEGHANFIVNPNKKALSSDVLELMLKMYNAVKEKFDIELTPEIKYFGQPDEREEYICAILYNR